MKTVRDLFKPFNGLSVDRVSFIPDTETNAIRYLRPSNNYKSTIKGYIDKSKVKKKYIFPKETIFVSTNGQGSHSYSYVSTFDFVPNSDIVVLIPRGEMSIEEKLFYAYCITANRYKYSYGRKPKGMRLLKLRLPSHEEIPNWLNEIANIMPKIESQICSDFLKDYDTIIKVTEELNGELVPISELFDYVTGFSSANVKRYAKNEEGNLIPFIRPSKTQYTSIDAYVDPNEVDDNMIFPEGTLYVSTDGEGSHTYAYVSITPFVPNSNTVVLLPKRDMPTKEKLFYALAITKNRYRFSYGRKPKGERFFNINVPKYPPRYVNNCIF